MEKPATLRAVLFDYGGVLAEEGFYNGLINQAEKQALDARSIPQEGLDAAYDSGFVTGQGSAADFWTLMRKRTGLEGEDSFLTERILDGFQLRPAMIGLVRKLRKNGYVTGILSDQTEWLIQLDGYDHFLQEFDQTFISYQLGKGKRDPTVFTDVVKRLELKPEQVLFIDDNENYVKNAIKTGLSAIQYIQFEQFIIEISALLGENFSN